MRMRLLVAVAGPSGLPRFDRFWLSVDRISTWPQVIYLVNMSSSDFQRKKNKWLPKIHAWIKVGLQQGLQRDATGWDPPRPPGESLVHAPAGLGTCSSP